MASPEKTIAFYRLLKREAGVNKPMAQANWYNILVKIGNLPVDKRVTRVGDQILIGDVYFADERAHLKLLKVRDVAAWLGVFNSKDKTLEDFEVGENLELYEIAVISFLDFGNVIGVVRGSSSSPTPTALVQWLHELKIFGESVELSAEAVISDRARRELARSPEVSRLETRVSTTKAQALAARGSKVSALLAQVNEDFGPVTVTLILKTSAAKKNHEGRQLLRAEAEHLAAAADADDVASAKATLVHFDADEKSSSEDVDFMTQRITAKRKIAALDDDGNPIRILSAVRAIMSAATAHDQELRGAVGEPAKKASN